MSEASKAVFLSYAREDTEAARRIADALRAFGVDVWFDQGELRGGDTWDQKIRKQIKDCALFMPVISAHTQGRTEGYFRREWKMAVERTHDMAAGVAFIVPVVIDDTKEADALVPDEFMTVQWMRLPGALPTPQFVEQIKRLLDSQRQPVAGSGSRKAFVERNETLARSATKQRVPSWAWAAVAVALVAGAAFFVSRKSENAGAGTRPPTAAKPPLDFASAKSIAVLPFVNMSSDKENEYLSDGITEEILNALAKVPGLRVPARTSSFVFKGKTEDIKKIGELLHVATVLEGSVQKSGNQLRITAQLINVADGYHLWSEKYEREMTSIFAIEDDIARTIVAKLKVTLSIGSDLPAAKKPTENPEAHRLYLLGRFHWAKFTAAELTSAKKYFEEAIKLDPAYAMAYCGLGDTYWSMGGWMMVGREAWVKQKEMAQRALAIDPDLADAHVTLGGALGATFDWQGCEREYKRALELNPNLALAYDGYASLRASFGQFDEAIAMQKKAVELDPLSPLMHCDLGWWLYYARRYDEAMAQTRKTLELDQNFQYAHGLLAWCLRGKGDMAGAMAESQYGKPLDPEPGWDAGLGYLYAVSGDRAKAERVLRDLDDLAKQKYVSPWLRAMVYLGLGEKENALNWLEKCYEEQNAACFWFKVEPINDSVRNEPRFQALLKKVGLDK